MFRLLLLAILLVVAWKVSTVLPGILAGSGEADPAATVAAAEDARLKSEIRQAAGIR